MPIGRKKTGTLDYARQQSCLGQRNVPEILVEVGLRSLSESTDRERSPLSQVYPIRVKLKNLLLTELLLQLFGDQHLCELSPHGFLGSEKESAGKLHGDRRSALIVPPANHVDPRRLRHAKEIHSAVLKEPPVFDGEHRLNYHRRNFVVLHQLTLGSLLGIEQRGNQLRLQFVCRKLISLADNVFHLAVLNLDACGLRAVVGLRARCDLNP